MKLLGRIALPLAVIGAINWGLVGLFNFDLVMWLDSLFGAGGVVAMVLYILVGISGLVLLPSIFAKSK